MPAEGVGDEGILIARPRQATLSAWERRATKSWL